MTSHHTITNNVIDESRNRIVPTSLPGSPTLKTDVLEITRKTEMALSLPSLPFLLATRIKKESWE